jgi:hypothetical protein
MAITTLDGAIAGMQWPRYFTKTATPTLVAGRPTSLWILAGAPGVGDYTTATTLNGTALSSTSAQVNGQINFVNPVSGNTYLARLQAAATQPGTLLLCDRLWHNGGISNAVTTAQAITSPTWPTRDAFGASNGDGVLLGVEVQVASTANTPTLTVSYTNQSGTATRTGTNIITTSAASAIGTFYQIGLQAGDTGVRSVQSLTLSTTWTGPTLNMVAYRPIVALELTSALVPNAIDSITAGFPQLFNGAVPFFIFIPSTTAASNISGQVVWTQG